MTLHGKAVLDFTDATSSNPNLGIIKVEPGDWNTLFDKIIELYHNIYIGESMINNFFAKIDKILDEEEDSSSSENPVEKMPSFYSMVDRTKIFEKLSFLADSLKESIYEDSPLVKKT